MNYGPTALLVAPNRVLAQTLANSLRLAGYRLTVVQTFDAAKRLITSGPDVLITELKLSEYNGLQLALRGQTMGIPTIVVADKTFEQDVEQLGAIWLSPENAISDELEITLSRALGPSTGSSGPWSDCLEADGAPARGGQETGTLPAVLH